jgi:putative DNA primase/helicase
MYVEYAENQKYAKAGADVADTPDSFNDAGYLIKENDLIIDIDDISKEIIQKIINHFNIKTQTVWTDRGAHFYFKKPRGFKGNKKICPLGFEVEYKHIKNTKAIAIKRNGKLREVENVGVREELPDIFYTRKKLENLLGMGAGEGRNDALFRHRMKIQDVDEWKRVLTFINENIFAEPLGEDEFNTITRDNVKVGGEKETPYDIAKNLIKQLKIHKFGDGLYSFNGTHFHNGIYFKHDIAQELAGRSSRFIDEVIKQIDMHLLPVEEPRGGWVVKLKNGILTDGEFMEIDYQEFTPFYIDIKYKEDAEPVAIVDEFLDTFTEGDPNYKQRILEIIGHCLITNIHVKRNKGFQKVHFFMGDGGNGKGLLLIVIRTLLGHENVSSISLDRIVDERYLYTMKGKLANCGDDIENKVIKEEKMKMLKNISSYDVIPLRELYKQSKDIALTASQIYTTNHILKSFEKGEAWKRRAVWCPSFAKPKKDDPNFQAKLLSPEALEYWLKLVIEAYGRLYETRNFTRVEKIEEYTELYHRENNSCLEWIESRDDIKKSIIGRRSPHVYEGWDISYKNWAEENGYPVQSQKQLNRTIEDELGLILKNTKIKGEAGRYWVEK